MKQKQINSKQNSKKSVSNEITFDKAMTLFANTCNLKFQYWFEKEILPIYLTQGPDSVTPAKIKKTYELVSTDVKASTHSKIFDKLLENYFSDVRAIDIFLKQLFLTKINSYEMKNSKLRLDAETLRKVL